jgi:hypothetical protein
VDDNDLKKLGLTVEVSHNGEPIVAFGDATIHLLHSPYRTTLERGDSRLLVHDHDGVVTWALLGFAESNVDGSNVRYEVLVHGSGVGSTLREPRHTWFGDESGYVFSVRPALLAWAFGELARWFDFDA